MIRSESIGYSKQGVKHAVVAATVNSDHRPDTLLLLV